VPGVTSEIKTASGLFYSLGIGEMPLIKQGTLSFWESKEHMKRFAYNMQNHTEVIQKTRKENWYSEEMFVRFKPIAAHGTIRGKNPLEGKL
jgi:hypothetical protein